MFQRILQWIKEIWRKMINQSDVKRALQVNVALSTEMSNALSLWSDMYANKAPWLSSTVFSLNLSAAIASEIARLVTIEMSVEIAGSPRAEYLTGQMESVIDKLRAQVEKGCAKGGLILKPYVSGRDVLVDFVQADMFFPVSFDASGNITSVIFVDQRTVGDRFYTRLEYHELGTGGCTIRNLAYKSTSRDNLGSQVAFSEIDDWAQLQPEAMITGIDRPLYAYFKYPLANNIDPTSPLGVSCYSRAVDLIKQADQQWSDFLWEFDSGRRALYVDVLAFGKDKDGKLNQLPNKRLYRTLDTGGAKDNLFEDWSPSIRQADYLAGLDAILKKIEYQTGLAYGTISDPNIEAKTATEIKITKQRTYATITDTQKALQKALDDLLYAMDTWATLSALAPRGAYSVIYTWDDSVVVDRDAQLLTDRQTVNMGAMSKVRYLMRNYGLSEADAKAWVAEADETPEKEDLFNGA